MLPYILYIFLIILEYFIIKNTTRNKDRFYNIFLSLACFELILFIGLRAYNIGADTQWYIYYLEKYKGIEFNEIFVNYEYYEYGYSLFTKLCSFLGLGKTQFLLLVTVIEVIPFFVALKKYSNNPLISILTFVCFQPLFLCIGMFRQAISISICFIGLDYIRDNKWLKYLLTILIASLFHASSLFLLIMYWLKKVEIQKKLLWILPSAFLVSIIFGNVLSHNLVALTSRYIGYLGSEYDYAESGSYTLAILFLLVSMFSIYSYLSANSTKYSQMDRLFILTTAILSIIQPLVYGFALFNRATAALCYFLPFTLAKLDDGIFTKTSKRSVQFILITLLALLSIRQISINQYVNPFIFYWESF